MTRLARMGAVLSALAHSKRVGLSQKHIQPGDGCRWNTNVKQATTQSYRESCRHHSIRLIEGVVGVHVTACQNGARYTGYRAASQCDLCLHRLREAGIHNGECHSLALARCRAVKPPESRRFVIARVLYIRSRKLCPQRLPSLVRGIHREDMKVRGGDKVLFMR